MPALAVGVGVMIRKVSSSAGEGWSWLNGELGTVVKQVGNMWDVELPGMKHVYRFKENGLVPFTKEEDKRRLRDRLQACLLYTSPSPRDVEESRMPSSA